MPVARNRRTVDGGAASVRSRSSRRVVARPPSTEKAALSEVSRAEGRRPTVPDIAISSESPCPGVQRKPMQTPAPVAVSSSAQ